MNWTKKKLGEILTIERGGSPRPIDKYITNSPDGINWIKISDATASDKYIFETKEKITKEGLHKTRMVNEGDFILSNSMSFGRPYIMKTTGCIHDGWLVLKQNGQKIFDTEFLYYLLSSPYVFKQFDYLAAGSTVRNLNIALVSSVEVPIPPLPEQQRIVSILDEAFAAIAKAKANAELNLRNAKELFESYLQGVFEKKGNGWECKELMEVCEQITDGSHFSPKSTNEGEYPYITVRDIDNDLIDFTKCKFINKTDYQSLLKNGCKPNNGDLLFSKDGTVGKVSLVDFEKDFVVLSSLAIISPKKDKLDSAFLKYILKNPLFLQKAIGMKTGVAIRRIILKNLKQIEISFPKSLKEQQTIVRQLDALRAETQKLEAVYQKKIDDLEELKKSILQKAFAGELRSPEGAAYDSEAATPLADDNDGHSPSDKKKKSITSPEGVK